MLVTRVERLEALAPGAGKRRFGAHGDTGKEMRLSSLLKAFQSCGDHWANDVACQPGYLREYE